MDSKSPPPQSKLVASFFYDPETQAFTVQPAGQCDQLEPDNAPDDTPEPVSSTLSTMEKPWWKSKTIWAAIAAISPPIIELIISAANGASLDWKGSLVTILGGLGAIAGRLDATHQIKNGE